MSQRKKHNLFGFVFLFLIAWPFASNAMLMNPILGLEIGGTLFDVTFHDQPGDTFNALWDDDNNNVFGDDPISRFSSAPTFWGDPVGAEMARDAIIAALGITGFTSVVGVDPVDGFRIPYKTRPAPNTHIIESMADANSFSLLAEIAVSDFSDSDLDDLEATSGYPWASFRESTTPAPAPATYALLLAGLLSASVTRRWTQSRRK